MKIARLFPNKKFRVGEVPNEDRKYLHSVIAPGMTWIEEKIHYTVTEVFTQSKEDNVPCECVYIIILKRKEKEENGEG